MGTGRNDLYPQNQIVIWSMVYGKEVGRVKVEEDDSIVKLLLSPENQIVALGLSQIYICEAHPGNVLF